MTAVIAGNIPEKFGRPEPGTPLWSVIECISKEVVNMLNQVQTKHEQTLLTKHPGLIPAHPISVACPDSLQVALYIGRDKNLWMKDDLGNHNLLSHRSTPGEVADELFKKIEAKSFVEQSLFVEELRRL